MVRRTRSSTPSAKTRVNRRCHKTTQQVDPASIGEKHHDEELLERDLSQFSPYLPASTNLDVNTCPATICPFPCPKELNHGSQETAHAFSIGAVIPYVPGLL